MSLQEQEHGAQSTPEVKTIDQLPTIQKRTSPVSPPVNAEQERSAQRTARDREAK
jgi:hypothetical protein